jgi:hypothetical protein
MVHPDPTLIEAPRDSLFARRFAVLPDQVHIPARVRFAIAPPTVIRRAPHDGFAAPILPWPFKLNTEVRPAPVVHPDPASVVSPRVSLITSRPTRLLLQRHTRVRICRTVLSPPVIRRAGNLPPAARIALPHGCLGKGTYQCAQHNQHPQNSHVDLRIRRKPGTTVCAKPTPHRSKPQRLCSSRVPQDTRAPCSHASPRVREGKRRAPRLIISSAKNPWLTESFYPDCHRETCGQSRCHRKTTD